ncbi:MAG: toxin-antitoxin system YwqK family antitoxin [Bacteroidota bacterium]
MKWFLIVLIAFLWIEEGYSFCQINQKDSKGKKTGKWEIYFKGTKKIFEEGNFINGRKEGLWKRYFSNGTSIMIESNYVNNRPFGSFSRYYLNGVLREKGSLILNKYNGLLVRYYSNGQIEYSGNFNSNGLENGKIQYYYENGNLEFEYQANNGEPEGKAIYYFEDGTFRKELNYSPGGAVQTVRKIEKTSESKTNKIVVGVKAPVLGVPRTRGKEFNPNSNNKCYTINDEIWQDGTFKNGELWDGKVYEYDKNGFIIRVKIFKQGVYHSDSY